ncbi:SDR family NAD(P)-dependent oxidoreductase [Parvibaculum sp.]|jgi:short-subunit dehydrogenase|uniref:SDR family NAD(P)-dependent oxidoreductase n=1 Tax=Parvibaculum sp. TaxID=2024848 RepID=UPI000C5AFEBA|nr:SDR family NAD(P)-dependent oxidoreductase [Parvibaculum sp.]MAM95734.1 oxidoreductase [Parvibaculum sp.]|tara:strand:+ start:16144 stop:16947 length:804 start_codon:yes stop_codon:yes gene_type:complete
MTEKGDIVWITGASSGIGRALALRMAREGYRVAVSARRAEELDKLKMEAEQTGSEIRPVPLDTTKPDEVTAGVAEIESEMGPIAIAVLCAGTYEAVLAHELTAARARPVFELNFMGTMNCLEALIPNMIARGHGRIAAVASLAGYFGLPTSAIYGASKAAIINMAEALQPDLAKHGVTIQIVNPGFVKTPLTDKNEFPMPFLMDVEDAADAFCKGLHSNRFEITFPRRFSLLLRLVQMLPYRLSLALTGKTLPKDKHPSITPGVSPS